MSEVTQGWVPGGPRAHSTFFPSPGAPPRYEVLFGAAGAAGWDRLGGCGNTRVARPVWCSHDHCGLGSRVSSTPISAVKSPGFQNPPRKPPGKGNALAHITAESRDGRQPQCRGQSGTRWGLACHGPTPLSLVLARSLGSSLFLWTRRLSSRRRDRELRTAPGEGPLLAGVQQEPQQIPRIWLGWRAHPEAVPTARAWTVSLFQARTESGSRPLQVIGSEPVVGVDPPRKTRSLLQKRGLGTREVQTADIHHTQCKK